MSGPESSVPGTEAVTIPAYVALSWDGNDGRADTGPARPGPKRSLDAVAIGRAGVELADEGGLAAVSMRSVAARIGVSSMALYRYVTSKRELMLLVCDVAFGPPPPSVTSAPTWRANLAAWARENHDRLAAHPWVVAVPVGEPPLLPNSVRWMESALQGLARTRLTEAQKLSALLLVDVYVRGQVALSTHFADADGGPDPQAGALYTQRLLRLADADRFPHLRVALEAGALADESDFTTDEFDFGLATILDGIETLVTAAERPVGRPSRAPQRDKRAPQRAQRKTASHTAT